MASPVQEDPYLALGVLKDADISAVRSAHRKLVLKFHPDRIKDEAERAKGKDLFQKVQQAYELLSDPVRRERYDDKVKIAELRKETMMREPVRSATYPMRPAAAPTSAPREYHNGAFYEERVPSGSYFESKERFEEPASRASSRKYDEYRPTEYRPSSKSGEKDRKTSTGSKWDKAAGGMSFQTAFNLKKKAAEAKERVRERDSKTKDREAQAAKAKTRDRDIRRERSENQNRRAFVVDEDSDSDTATFVSRSTVRPSKSSPRSKVGAEPESRRTPERSHSRRDDEDDSHDDDKWERHHASTRAYIAQSRPNMIRSGSDAHQYWDSEDRGYSRRSGSDSDRRPTSSKGRPPNVDLPKNRSTPSMPTHTSSPANLRNINIEEREPMHQRSTSSGTIPREREHRREIPSFGRSQTMPNSRSSKKDTVPAKGSNLKHSENQDSGYGSSSSPHTPEMGGISPTRESSRPEPSRQSSKRYQIVEPVEDEEFSSGSRHRTILIDEDERHRRVSSPPRDRSDRRERSDRAERPKINIDGRTRSNRNSSGQLPAEARPQPSRHESSRYGPSSPRESPPVSRHNSNRKLFNEITSEDREPSSFSRKYTPESVSTSPRIDPDNANYGPYSHRRRESQDDRDHDYYPGSNHRQELRQPMTSRRPSVY